MYQRVFWWSDQYHLSQGYLFSHAVNFIKIRLHLYCARINYFRFHGQYRERTLTLSTIYRRSLSSDSLNNTSINSSSFLVTDRSTSGDWFRSAISSISVAPLFLDRLKVSNYTPSAPYYIVQSSIKCKSILSIFVVSDTCLRFTSKCNENKEVCFPGHSLMKFHSSPKPK